MPNEVLTLQLGNYANFVGAHFWNIQDEAVGYTSQDDWQDVAGVIDHDVLLTWSEDRHGNATATPRLVLVDSSGSLGGVSFSRDAGIHSNAGVTTWHGTAAVHKATPIAKSSFTRRLEEQALQDISEEDAALLQRQQAELEEAAEELQEDGGVRYWTDYLKAEIHPDSVLLMPSIWQASPGFGDEAAAAATASMQEQVMDRLRLLSEACDSMQGVQILADDLSGFGRLSVSLLTELADEFPNRSLMYYSVRPPSVQSLAGSSNAVERCTYTAADALSLAEVPELASLYVPLTVNGHAQQALPHLSLPAHAGPFHSSALLAAALDSATLPFRLTGAHGRTGPAIGGVNMHSLVQLLAGPGANLAAAALQMPAGALPSNLSSLAEAGDERLRHEGAGRNGAAASGSMSAAATAAAAAQEMDRAQHMRPAVLSLRQMAVLSPGIHMAKERCLAESYVLRGARTMQDEPATTSTAAAALDALLAAGGRRCVQHRCIVPMPLPVPLPFPAIFNPSVSRNGLPYHQHHQQAAAAAPAGAQGHGGSSSSRAGEQSAVATCPVLTQLSATNEFEARLETAARELGSCVVSQAGQRLLQSWGYDGSEVQELQERLRGLARQYQEGDDDF